jgi:hypothetical protein
MFPEDPDTVNELEEKICDVLDRVGDHEFHHVVRALMNMAVLYIAMAELNSPGSREKMAKEKRHWAEQFVAWADEVNGLV